MAQWRAPHNARKNYAAKIGATSPIRLAVCLLHYCRTDRQKGVVCTSTPNMHKTDNANGIHKNIEKLLQFDKNGRRSKTTIINIFPREGEALVIPTPNDCGINVYGMENNSNEEETHRGRGYQGDAWRQCARGGGDSCPVGQRAPPAVDRPPAHDGRDQTRWDANGRYTPLGGPKLLTWLSRDCSPPPSAK